VNTALWVLQVFLAVIFLLAGSAKIFMYEKMKKDMDWVKSLPESTVKMIGFLEILGAIGIILPAALRILPWLTKISALGFAIIMILAAIMHYKRGERKEIVENIAFLACAVFIVFGRTFFTPL